MGQSLFIQDDGIELNTTGLVTNMLMDYFWAEVLEGVCVTKRFTARLD
jgi:hypothetical protein